MRALILAFEPFLIACSHCSRLYPFIYGEWDLEWGLPEWGAERVGLCFDCAYVQEGLCCGLFKCEHYCSSEDGEDEVDEEDEE